MNDLRCIHSIAPSGFVLFLNFVPEVDKLWQTSHLNLTGLESRQVFLPDIYPPVDVSTQCQTSECKVENRKQCFWTFLPKHPHVSNDGVLWSCMAHSPVGDRGNGVRL